MYKLYIELCIVLIISWLFDSPFPTCDQWSMIQPGQLGTPGRRSNTCIFQWTVVCHGFQVGSSWLKSWGFEANKKKHTDQRGPRAKGLPFCLKHFLLAVAQIERGLNCELFLNIIHEAIHALAQSQFAFGKIGHHEPEDESVGEPSRPQ